MPSETKLLPVRRSLWRRISRYIILLVCFWFFGTGVTAWLLTFRLPGPSPEPPPAVAWGTLDQVRLTTSDGQQIGGWLNRKGEHPAVVLFLHGVSNTRSVWLPQMEKMAREGYACMAISFRTYGDSTGRIEDFGYSGRLDVEAAVRYLREQFPGRPIVVVGNSLGSAAAIFAAGSLDHEVAGYLLESPYFDLRTAVKNRADYAPPPLNWVLFQGLNLWGHVLLPRSITVMRPIEHIAEIPADVPVTLFAARKEELCKLWEVEALYHRVQSHAKLIVVEGSRHGACSRSDPELYDAALRELLQKADAKFEGVRYQPQLSDNVGNR